MPSVDNRVVGMKFDNAAFERGVSTTLSTLSKLKDSIGHMSGVVKGFGDFHIKSDGLAPLSHGADTLITKFSALQVAGVTAVATIANRAVTAGTQMVKSLTISPISGGLREYEKKLTSIQTILGNTAAAGTTMDQVSAALNELNTYSDKTIYNFGEMARNIGTFTAAGVDLKTSVASIKGLANLAALSGSTSEQASTAMYQLSQAISAGRVSLMDWNSVVNAGMGGSVFQRQLAQTAVAMGKIKAGAVKLEGPMKNVKINGESFRQSIAGDKGPSWLTSDVLTTALGTFTGDMKEADLVAKGFSKSQAKLIMEQAKTATSAATVVKTGSQLISTLRESAESGWAQTWEIIVGDFEEAPKLWTNINNAIGGIIQHSADARNKVLQDWKNDNGRHFFLVGIKNGFLALKSVIDPVRDAFRTVFPPITGKILADLSEKFMNFTHGLIVGETTANNIRRTFTGVFTALKIGLGILAGLGKGIFGVLSIAGKGSGGLLAFTATVGDMVTKVGELLTKTGAIEKFFAIFLAPLKLLRPLVGFVVQLANALSSLFTGDISGFRSQISDTFKGLQDFISGLADRLGTIGDIFSDVFRRIQKFFMRIAFVATAGGHTLIASVANTVIKVSGAISRFFGNLSGKAADFASVLSNIVEAIHSFFSGLAIGGPLGSITDLFDRCTESANRVKDAMDFGAVFSSFNSGASSVAGGGASGLAKAGSVVASIWNGIKATFSGIGNFFSTIASALGGFFGAVGEKIKNFIKGLDGQDVIAALDVGILLVLYRTFGGFFKNMNGILKDGRKVLHSAAGSFNQLTDTLKTMQNAVRAQMIRSIAISVGLLVAALFVLARIDAKALGIALGAVAVIFGQIATFMKIMDKIDPKSMLGATVGMVAIASAVLILAGAIAILGNLDPKTLIQGSIAVGVLMASLAGMVAVLNKTKGIFAAATGLLILSFALSTMIGTIVLFSKIPWDTIWNGLARMALTLVALGLAMRAFPKDMVVKTAGIAILAGALLILSKSLVVLSQLSLFEIAKALVAMGAALFILATAAAVMEKALPGAKAMLIMAGAIAILAPALALLGKLPLKVIGKGLLAIAGIAAILAGTAIVLSFFATALSALGVALLLVGAGTALFAAGIAVLATVGTAGFAVITAGIVSLLALLPLMARQFGYALVTFAQVLANAAPAIASAAGAIFMAFINEIARRVPEVADAGLRMIVGILTAIRNHIGEITQLAIDIVVEFATTLAKNVYRLVKAGGDLLLAFIRGLAKWIRENHEQIGNAALDLVTAIIDGIVAGMSGLGHLAIEAVKRLGQDIIDGFKEFFGIKSPSTVFSDLGGFLIQGLANGIKNGWKWIKEALMKLAEKIPGPIRKVLGIESPSKVFHTLGEYLGQGLANGISNTSSLVGKSAETLGSDAVTAVRDTMSMLSDSLSVNMDTAPTIRPVLDLSHVEANAGRLNGMLETSPVSVNAAYSASQAVLNKQKANDLVSVEATKTRQALEALAATKQQTEAVRPMEFHIDTVEDGDSLLRRARATNKMLTLAEGGDSTQILELAL